MPHGMSKLMGETKGPPTHCAASVLQGRDCTLQAIVVSTDDLVCSGRRKYVFSATAERTDCAGNSKCLRAIGLGGTNRSVISRISQAGRGLGRRQRWGWEIGAIGMGHSSALSGPVGLGAVVYQGLKPLGWDRWPGRGGRGAGALGWKLGFGGKIGVFDSARGAG